MSTPVTVDELVSALRSAYKSLDDASGVVDPSPDGTEEYAYQHELESAKDVLDRYDQHGVSTGATVIKPRQIIAREVPGAIDFRKTINERC